MHPAMDLSQFHVNSDVSPWAFECHRVQIAGAQPDTSYTGLDPRSGSTDAGSEVWMIAQVLDGLQSSAIVEKLRWASE